MVRFYAPIHDRFGKVLGGVARKSLGDLLFAPSVAFVFTLSDGDPIQYCIPVLVLSLADAAGALIGKRYGFSRFETDDGHKSLEGSGAFFMVAFAATHIPILLYTSTGRLESLLIAVVVGVLLMLLEAIAWRGLDNLFIPLVTYICLSRLLSLGVDALVLRLGILSSLLLFLGLWTNRTRFSTMAVIGAALIFYASWMVGGFRWLLAPVSVFIGYWILCRGPVSRPQVHNVHTIGWIGGTGLFWLGCTSLLGTVNTVYPYGVAYACHLAMISLTYLADPNRRLPLTVACPLAAIIGFIFPSIPYVIYWKANPNIWKLSGFAVFLILASCVVFMRWQPRIRVCASDDPRWYRQGIIAIAASLIAFGIITWMEPWSKSFE
jgi:phytol kinase